MNLTNVTNEIKTEEKKQMELSITREKFNNFLRVVKLIENVCNDCDVVKSQVRQKNNQGISIVEMDLTPIFGAGCDFTLSQLKQKISLLKIFEKDDSGAKSSETDDNILFKADDDSYIFMDNISEMLFRKPVKKFLDNIYIDDPVVIKQLEGDPGNLLFEYTISSNIARRICNVCEGFSNDIITCKIKENTADFHISTVTNEHFSEVIKNIPLNQIQDKKYTFNFQSFAFTMDGGDIKVSVYKPAKEKIVVWKFKQDIFQVPVTITGRSDITIAK